MSARYPSNEATIAPAASSSQVAKRTGGLQADDSAQKSDEREGTDARDACGGFFLALAPPALDPDQEADREGKQEPGKARIGGDPHARPP